MATRGYAQQEEAKKTEIAMADSITLPKSGIRMEKKGNR